MDAMAAVTCADIVAVLGPVEFFLSAARAHQEPGAGEGV